MQACISNRHDSCIYCKKQIPMEVEVDGQIYTASGVVLDTWKNEFVRIYQFPKDQFDGEFRSRIIHDPWYQTQIVNGDGGDTELNKDIEYSEIKLAIDRSKNKKVVGVDYITNEILKNESVMELVHSFITTCFKIGKIPQV